MIMPIITVTNVCHNEIAFISLVLSFTSSQSCFRKAHLNLTLSLNVCSVIPVASSLFGSFVFAPHNSPEPLKKVASKWKSTSTQSAQNFLINSINISNTYVLLVQLPQVITSIILLCATTATCTAVNSTLELILNSNYTTVITTIARYTVSLTLLLLLPSTLALISSLSKQQMLCFSTCKCYLPE